MATYDASLSNNYGGTTWMRLTVTEKYDSNTNTSTFDWDLTVYANWGPYHLDYVTTIQVYVNGWVKNDSSNRYNFTNTGSISMASGTTGAIAHNADGSGSMSVYAGFSDSGPILSGNTGWQTFTFYDPSRPPTATVAPTFDTRASGSSNIKMYSSGTATGRPAIDSFKWRMYANGGGTPTIVDSNSPYTWPNANTDTDYYVTAQAHNSEGFGPESTGSWAYAAPRITGITLPSQGTVGKPYSGTVSGNNVDSYSAVSGSLPPGLSFSGGTLSGSPLTPGTYTFKIRATRDGVSYVDSATQTIQILAGGPWVKSPNGTAVFSGSVYSVYAPGGTVYLSTTTSHGISEINQPITLSGFTGMTAWLNGTWLVKSWGDNWLGINADGYIDDFPFYASGFYESQWKRSSIKVYVNGQWVQAWMRYWDAASQTWKNTA